MLVSNHPSLALLKHTFACRPQLRPTSVADTPHNVSLERDVLPHDPATTPPNNADLLSLPRKIASSFEANAPPHLYPSALLTYALMYALEKPKSRKRPRSSQESGDLVQESLSKKQKPFPKNHARPYDHPPSFWDTLSKIHLTRRALREFDRRNIQEAHQQICIIPSKLNYPKGRARLRLKRLAQRGGPDLSHLRGVRLRSLDS